MTNNNNNNKKPRTLLIDADILLFQAVASAEQETSLAELVQTSKEAVAIKDMLVTKFMTSIEGSDISLIWSDLPDAIITMEDKIRKLKDELKADNLIFCISDKKNFRKTVLSTYKGNRVGSRKPINYNLLKQYLIDNYNTKTLPELEGDDVMGILATNKDFLGDHEKIIVSIDKDMLQIPVGVFSDMKVGPDQTWEESIVYVDEYAGKWKHWEQTLAGDKTDGYDGLPGCGPVGAVKLVGTADGFDKASKDNSETLLTDAEAWSIILEQYRKKGLTKKDMLKQARVAKILTSDDYDLDKLQIKLFEIPPE